MKMIQAGVLRVVFAVGTAAALSLQAADGVWGRTDNTDVVTPVAWSNAANWAGAEVADGGGQAFFTNAYPNLAYRAVDIPPEGVALSRFWFKNYEGVTATWSGAYLLVSGGPMFMEGTGGAAPRLDSSSDQLWIFSEISGTNGLTVFPNYSINVFADSSYTGLTTLETGYWITRFDGVVNSSSPVLRDYASTNEFVLTGGRLSFYGRPSKTATITSNWSLVEGRTLATFVSGSNAGTITPGAVVTGGGLPGGTFVRRIINSTNIQLSEAAPVSGNPVSLVFGPVASECYQTISSVDSRNSSSEFILNKNGANVLRVDVGELKGTGNVLQRVSPGQPTGVLSLHNTRSFGGAFSLKDAWLELPKDGDLQPTLSNLTVATASTLDVPGADTVASVPSLGGVTNTLTKVGAGRLTAGLVFGSSLSFVVQEGSLELPRPLAASLLTEASLRLDASRTDTLTLDAEGRVSRWADADGRANGVTNPVTARQPLRVEGALNGLPVVDFGPYVGSSAGCGLFLETRKTNVVSAFVVYYGRAPDAVIFGESPGISACAYTRSGNTGNTIWNANTGALVKDGVTDLDGIKVSGAQTVLQTNEFHLVSVVGTGIATVGALGNDRNYRSGGQQVAEVILFDRVLTLAEQATVDAYLMEKWFGSLLKRQVAGLTLAHGTRLALPYAETLVVSNLTLSGEVWLEGPGQVLVSGGLTQSGTVHFANGGGLSVSGVGGSLATVEPAVAASPSFWVDACALTNAGAAGVVVENGTNFVTRWNDVRGVGYNFATNITLRPTLRINDINGLPSVYFARILNVVPSLSEALFWDQPMNDIRAVFMVVGSQEGGGILLGSSAAENTQDFYRNAWSDSSRTIFNASGTGASAALLNGLFYLNGYAVNPAATSYNGFFQLVEAYPTGPVKASAFAADRNVVNGNGCQRICEMILFNRVLSEQEKLNTAEYLMRKWFGRGVPRAAAMSGVSAISAEGEGSLGVASTNDFVSVGYYTGSGDVVKTGEGTLVLNSIDIAERVLDVQAGTLVLKAGDPAERVPGDAFLHVDAAAANAFSNVVVNGTNFVEKWWHADGGAVYAQMRNTATRVRPHVLPNALNGLPVVEFGPLLTGNPANAIQCFLEFSTACTNLRDAFVVIGSQAGGNTVLGTKSNPRHFWRDNTSSASLLHASYAPLQLRLGETRRNGVPVVPTSVGLSGGYDLVSFSTYPGGAIYTDGFAIDAYNRTGGQRLGEVLLFDRALTYQERLDIEAYLMKKWFNVATPGYEVTAVGSLAVASGARVEIDGSLAVDGLSGGGTVAGDLTLNGGAVIKATAVSGVLSGLTVDGTVTVAGSGTVMLEGDVDTMKSGLYEVLTCTSLADGDGWLSGWALTGAPSVFSAKLVTDGSHLYLRLTPKGSLMMMR